MITTLAAVLLGSAAAAAGSPPPAAPAAPAVHASTAAAPAAPPLGVSTYTVSTLYTGDRVRDPFLSPSAGGGPARARDRNAPLDIHSLELHGIMRDERSDFAIFSTDTGETIVLRGSRLYDGRNKIIPGITGRIRLKQKRAELITADKDVQIYSLGDPEAFKAKDAQPNDSGETGSGRSP